ncbi:RluA family pseudouridine synthase [uncultured Methylibium sp.]|uniref:RluA family pseudouridine synthase n=1 Tax=uncultured Methylibium sp. TaxID=381093 RepID=UPI0025E4C36B|nr:RluA family pseudouridine synthase [uncultured Methylibium sp.]
MSDTIAPIEPRYADAHLLVVDKPAGLLAVPGRGADKQDCLARRVQAQWPDARVVHRLDQATSGLMLFARGADLQRQLGRLFELRQVDKRYVAVVAGCVVDESGRIERPIAVDWPNRPLRRVDAEGGQAALTRWRMLARDLAGDTSRLELDPETGRTHQLRVHLQAIGHPILGDALYAPPAVRARSPRLLLHASELAFAHPQTGQALHLVSPPDF